MKLTIEAEATIAFNALPQEERKHICYFRNLERIRELERQMAVEKGRHASAIRKINETIERTRGAMREGR